MKLIALFVLCKRQCPAEFPSFPHDNKVQEFAINVVLGYHVRMGSKEHSQKYILSCLINFV